MKNALRSLAVLICAALVGAAAHAAMGMVELAEDSSSGPVTVFYPTAEKEGELQRGPFSFEAALDARPGPGNRHLIVISHGSPSSPWVHLDLARALVAAGFVVAMPEHYGDNYKNDNDPGPPAWKRRPKEVSQAITRVGKDARFSQALDLARVGMYGMSAGGHTALTLAGARWSPARLRQHCQNNISEDFHACAGPYFSLNGGIFDGVKKNLVLTVINQKFDDATWYEHTDPRIKAIVAGVPFAADFDPDSFKEPKSALAIISAKADRWLNPKFHSDYVLQHCKSCENLLALPNGGHGALISPVPPNMNARFAALIDDAPDFQRDIEVPRLNAAITEFFKRQLLGKAK